MKKLTPVEQYALKFLSRVGTYCPGTDARGLEGVTLAEIRRVLTGLERKKRAISEPTDDGPAFTLTALGRSEALDREGQ